MSCSLADVLTFQTIVLLQSHYLLKVITVALHDEGSGRFLSNTGKRLLNHTASSPIRQTFSLTFSSSLFVAALCLVSAASQIQIKRQILREREREGTVKVSNQVSYTCSKVNKINTN